MGMIHPIRTGLQGFCLLLRGRASPPDLQDYSGNTLGGVKGVFPTRQQRIEGYNVNGCAGSPSGGGDVEPSEHDPTMKRGLEGDHGQQDGDWADKRCAICRGG
jgi:hypothetical protein